MVATDHSLPFALPADVLAATFTHADAGIALVDPQRHWIAANPAYCRMLGFSWDELQSLTPHDITHPEDQAEDARLRAELFAGERESFTLEKRYRRKDGAWFWAALRVTLVRDAAGRPIYTVAVVEDITARKQLEAEHTALIDLTDAALAEFDLDALLPVLLDQTRRTLGTDAATVLLLDESGRALTVRASCGLEEEVSASVTIPVGQGFAGTIVATGKPLVLPNTRMFPVVSPWMRERIASAVGVPLILDERVFGVLHASTYAPRAFTDSETHLLERVARRIALALDRVVLHAQLTEREAQLRQILEHAPDGFFHGDSAGRILTANRRAYTMLGYPNAAALLGRAFDELVAPEDLPSLAEARRVIAEGMTDQRELRMRCADGSFLPVEISANRIADGTQQAFIRDLTERKQHDAERASMLDIVAHELRTPLTTLLANAQILERNITQQKPVRADQMQRLVQAGRHMNRLLNDLLDAARLENNKLALEWEQVDLRAICQQVVADLLAATGRAIELELAPDPLTVAGDPLRLTQIFTNVAGNALKYSPPDTPVRLSVCRHHDHARVLVQDAGPGIPAAAQAKLFTRFYRVPGIAVQQHSGGSLGLGLYITKQLVDAHHGSIGVQSAAGKGTTFFVTLPLVEADS